MDTHTAQYSRLLGKETCGSLDDSERASLEDEARFQHASYSPASRTNSTRRWPTILLAVVLIAYVSASSVFMVLMYHNGEYRVRAPDPPYTPARDAIRYTTLKSADSYDEDLQGFPSKAHDKAWLDLVSPSLSRVSYEEMQLGREDPDHSVAVAGEGGGYMASLGVFHELHCLRRLKLYLHKEHYYPKLAHGSEEDTYELGHLNHCLEAIRLSLMCAGNTALYSFQWPDSNEEVRKPKTKTNSERTCVDWNLIDQWARNRSIGMSPTLERPDVEPDHAHMHHDG